MTRAAIVVSLWLGLACERTDTPTAACVATTELCNGADDDCDGFVDNNPQDGVLYFGDRDGDGFGDSRVPRRSCTPPPGFTDNAADCDDDDPSFGDGLTWYVDHDRDGFGADSLLTCATQPPEGTVAQSGDCDDAASGTNPAAPETCDGVDQDCDGAVDDDPIDGSWLVRDRDGDGYGADATPEENVCNPTGYAVDRGDCDDQADAIHPDALEYCDRLDNDCDGVVDDDCSIGRPFPPGVVALALVGDWNGDGLHDLVVDDNGAVGVSLGGPPLLEAPVIVTDQEFLCAADLDHDGRSDIVTRDEQGISAFFAGSTDGVADVFVPLEPHPARPICGEFDAMPGADIALVDARMGVACLYAERQDLDVTFVWNAGTTGPLVTTMALESRRSPAGDFTCFGDVYGPIDVDRDGFDDLIVERIYDSGSVSDFPIALGPLDGGLALEDFGAVTLAGVYGGVSLPTFPATALITKMRDSGSAAVLFDGWSGTPLTPSFSGTDSYLPVGDLHADGKPDVVVAAGQDGEVYVRDDPAGYIRQDTLRRLPLPPLSTGDVLSDDLDGDGFDDLVLVTFVPTASWFVSGVMVPY